jgi:hypothetical protein
MMGMCFQTLHVIPQTAREIRRRLLVIQWLLVLIAAGGVALLARWVG